MNTELNKILNSNMCKTQKKFVCYKNMLANDMELQKYKKKDSQLYNDWYDLERKVFKR